MSITLSNTELEQLRYPAFRAGVESQLRWGQQRQDLLHALDSLGQPALLCDSCGRPLHRTPCLEALLAAEPEAEILRGEMMGVVAALRQRARGDRAGGVAPPHAPEREVRTRRSRYRVSGCVYGGPRAGERAVVLVGVTCLTPARRSEQEIREKWSLTRAEARVALRLAEGRSNEEIARELYLSPHTVRRHTEKVLQKMNLRSRAEVAAHLHG